MLWLTGFYSTTSYALTAAFYLLCTEPEALQKVLDEIEEVIGMDGIPTYADLKNFRYLESFFKETLRLHPSAITVPRVTGRPTQVSGHRIPSGVHTFFDVQALHTDKMYWGDDADVFRPDRWLEEGVEITEGAYIPFGVGPMKCIGMKLAHIESKIVLIRTLQRFHVSLKPNFTPVKAFYLACGFKTLEVELVRREC
ncbi:cytochrome P450 [Chytridium lagenaria]|nr:cytochrome P450 [Chytridium lagenaria]